MPIKDWRQSMPHKEPLPPMPIQRYSSLLWGVICLLVMCTFLPMVLLSPDSRMDGKRETFTALVKHWEVAFGSETPEEGNWLPLDHAARAMLDEYEGTVWLQRPLPDLEWRNPYLFLSMMKRFEVYLDGERIYSFNMDNKYTHIHPMRMLHPVPIAPDIAGKHLLIHAKWEGDPLFGFDMALIGESDQLLYASVLSELAFIVYAILGIAAGVIGLAMFVKRREPVYGWFACFCLAAGFGLLFTCRSLQWFIDMKEVYYWELLLTPLAIWACTGFYANALSAHRRPLIRTVHYAMGVYIVFAAAIAAWAPALFRQISGFGDASMAIIGFATVTYVLIRFSSREGTGPEGEEDERARRHERQWLARGYWTFTICGLVVTVAYAYPTLLTQLVSASQYAYRIIEGMLPNALLLFIICMVMVVVGRVRRVHAESERNAAELLVKNSELEQFHRNLEQLVETRTSELERANRTLAVTLREKAETLAEMSVLEERNRIAYEMHDVVGHTLTAAIVQLEATKSLSEREGGIPLEKLDLLSELVRKGLDDIRKTVRLMKSDDDPTLSLEASLRELVQFAEDTMEIAVETDIVLPRDLSLGKVTEGVLYHALQEGMTNGIRHGRSGRFRFTLKCEDEELRFLLVSDGEPLEAAVPGFGISSMMERVELLGGAVSLRSSTAVDGSPAGCELAIRIPFS